MRKTASVSPSTLGHLSLSSLALFLFPPLLQSLIQLRLQFPITALREIKLLKLLSHPNILKLEDMAVEHPSRPSWPSPLSLSLSLSQLGRPHEPRSPLLTASFPLNSTYSRQAQEADHVHGDSLHGS